MLTHDAKDDDPPLLWPSSETRRQLGDISSVTLWRRVNDRALDFPKPIKIAGRNYFVPPEIVAWLKRQAGARGGHSRQKSL